MPTHYNPQLEEEKKRREEKIAKSQASASPIQQASPMQAPGMGPQQQSPLAQAGMMVGKQLLGSAVGPLGGVLGGLFNEGGKVPMQGYNTGGWLSSLLGPGKPRTSRKFGESKKKPRTQTTAQARGYNEGGWLSSLLGPGKPRTSRRFGESKKKPRTQTTGQARGYNVGGMVPNLQMMGPLNPHGYNEGGAVQATPIKKVMDEQKLDQQAKAFELDEMRKQEKHQLDMKLKQQQFQQAQQMKKAAATTNKTAKAPLAKK